MKTKGQIAFEAFNAARRQGLQPLRNEDKVWDVMRQEPWEAVAKAVCEASGAKTDGQVAFEAYSPEADDAAWANTPEYIRELWEACGKAFREAVAAAMESRA